MLTITEAKIKFGIYPEFAPQDESDAQAQDTPAIFGGGCRTSTQRSVSPTQRGSGGRNRRELGTRFALLARRG